MPEVPEALSDPFDTPTFAPPSPPRQARGRRATAAAGWRVAVAAVALLAPFTTAAQPARMNDVPPLSSPLAPDDDSEHADPYRWLEEVDGERARAWVAERNRHSEGDLAADPAFETRQRLVREVLDSREQIPYVQRRGDALYNFWRDAEHPRGLWRRTTLDGYRSADPPWETVLDLDALARQEGENWVWSGAVCHGPSYRRCLLKLSRGGADAVVVREFDTVERAFVAGGFVLPEAKTRVDWFDADSLLVATDTGPGSMTDAGYPRTVRHWRRGRPLADAPLVFEASPDDVSAFASVDRTPGFERVVVGRAIDFYRSEAFLWPGPGAPLQRLAKPDDAELSFWRDRALLTLRSDWETGGRRWPAGALLAGDAAFLAPAPAPSSAAAMTAPAPAAAASAASTPAAAAAPAPGADWTALFEPTATRSLAGFALTRGTVVVEVLDNVASRLEEWTPQPGGGWRRREVAAGAPGQLGVASLHDPLQADDPLADAYLVNEAGFLQPDTLALARTGRDGREVLKSRPRFFDDAGMRVEQRFARSRDGTRVPYFVVWPAGARADGDNPTLLYGYGGFEVSLAPWYSGATGRLWLAEGGVYAVANIRGGGEFGPAWHQAALGASRQRAFDDFAAVAEDLVAAGITRPARLGIQGGSNGGLLVGAVMVQRPELFGAVVCQVPLLDMLRFHRLLAGASWTAEYGDPDDPAARAVLRGYSPYHAVRAGAAMPPVLFTTSTRDDRVHPGHARKMAARMIGQGHRVWYWENVEGGHAGAADHAQRARMMALEHTFLWRQLGRR